MQIGLEPLHRGAHRAFAVEPLGRSVGEHGRDLERFFHDWTERPGSPVLSAATDYLPEQRQARVVLKQTQAGEPFHFPLTVAFTVPGSEKPVAVSVTLQ